MTGGAWLTVPVAPQKERHKESLAIYKSHTEYLSAKITRLLNHKFKDELPGGHIFDANLVEEKWEEMKQTEDEVLLKVEQWGKDYWRVKRVLKWAEKDDERRPL